MLKTWFTHIIYEQCINIAFGNVTKNFVVPQNIFSVGQKFSTLYLKYNQWSITTPYEVILENAVILEKAGSLLYIEYDIMQIVDGPDGMHREAVIRDVDEVLIDDITRVVY